MKYLLLLAIAITACAPHALQSDMDALSASVEAKRMQDAFEHAEIDVRISRMIMRQAQIYGYESLPKEELIWLLKMHDDADSIAALTRKGMGR